MRHQMPEPKDVASIMGGDTRSGLTRKIKVQDTTHGGLVEGYITGNLALDGTLKEVFLHGFGKEGSTMSGWTQFSALLLSRSLQAGTDLASLVGRVGEMKFEPYGSTVGDPEIKWVPSIPAYIVAWLALRLGDEASKKEIHRVMEGWK